MLCAREKKRETVNVYKTKLSNLNGKKNKYIKLLVVKIFD